MISISLCMIVKNEEEVLDECLKSIYHLCDEIVIVDTGSTDRTKKIARKYTERIFDFTWINDFSAARNFAFCKATKEYILWLDADDIVMEEDQKKLLKLKQTLTKNVDSVSMNYILTFDDYGNPSFYFRRNRLVKRSNQFVWKDPVHEYLEVGGEIVEADIAITHRKEKKQHVTNDRNIKIYEENLKMGKKFSPRSLFYYANELKDHMRYEEAIQYYKKFLDTNKGWIEDEIRACLYMSDIYRNNKEVKKELAILLQTLKYDVPRPEMCCKLGDIFFNKNQYQAAIFWYTNAVTYIQATQGFQHVAYSTWYPHLSLCAAYWRVGNKEKAQEHHEIVKKIRPKDPKVLYNQQFFNK